MRSTAALLVLGTVCAAAMAGAQDGAEVRSPRAESVAVTIYRDDLALITETRTVDLPAGGVTVFFDGVVETLLPQSAIVTDIGRPLAESNFDFDRLTPRTLLERSIGNTVTVTRTNPTTGRVTRAAATIVAVGEGVVLQSVDGNEALYCSGLPERLEFAELPAELLSKPRLSVRLAAGQAGPRVVKISYLAHGFSWSSDYVAQLNERSTALSLKGWATLENATSAELEQAEVQLVAGRLNVLAAEDGGSAAEPVYAQPGETQGEARDRLARETAAGDVQLLRECFATEVPGNLLPEALDALRYRLAAPAMARSMLEELTVTAARIEREELGDYQLYRLPWRTDLGARQTKQVLFLDRSAVRVERLYGLRLDSLLDSSVEEVTAPNTLVRFDNTERSGLGEPLPKGVVRVFESYAGRAVLAGEAEIGDRPVGSPVELAIGGALNVMIEVTTSPDAGRRDRVTATTQHRIVNNKAVPIDVEIRQGVESYYTNVELEETSRPMRRRYGDLAWRFTVRPGETLLSYEISALVPR